MYVQETQHILYRTNGLISRERQRLLTQRDHLLSAFAYRTHQSYKKILEVPLALVLPRTKQQAL